MISAVVPNRDGAAVLPRCLEHLAAAGLADVVVVDDGSTDGSDAEAAMRGAHVLRSPGRGFAAAVNHGVAATTGSHVLVLNSDAFVRPETPGLLADTLDGDPGLALTAAALEDEAGNRTTTFGRDVTLVHALRNAISLPPPRPAEGVGLDCAAY